jgi:hypothetical protein
MLIPHALPQIPLSAPSRRAPSHSHPVHIDENSPALAALSTIFPPSPLIHTPFPKSGTHLISNPFTTSPRIPHFPRQRLLLLVLISINHVLNRSRVPHDQREPRERLSWAYSLWSATSRTPRVLLPLVGTAPVATIGSTPRRRSHAFPASHRPPVGRHNVPLRPSGAPSRSLKKAC